MTFINKMISSAVLTAAVLLPASAFAASNSLTVNIPFAFVVNGRTLPAGSYAVDVADSNSVLSIRNRQGGLLVASNPGTGGSSNKPGLIFEKRGATEYLVGVHTDSQNDRSLPLPTVQQVSST